MLAASRSMETNRFSVTGGRAPRSNPLPRAAMKRARIQMLYRMNGMNHNRMRTE